MTAIYLSHIGANDGWFFFKNAIIVPGSDSITKSLRWNFYFLKYIILFIHKEHKKYLLTFLPNLILIKKEFNPERVIIFSFIEDVYKENGSGIFIEINHLKHSV